MKQFKFKISVNWLPSLPPLEFEGIQEAEDEPSVKKLITDFYTVDLSVTENEIEFDCVEEIE